MPNRIPGGNAPATTITFSDGEPEIATAPSDREIIAALAKSKADADFCAKSWEREIEANNALRARLKRIAEVAKLFDEALLEAESILGGEYALHYGPLFDKASTARAALKLAGA